MHLETVWFLLWGLLWAIFFITDGFDFGIGSMIPFLAKNEDEKRMMYNSLGPVWDGNEVWLITAGGVTFAAFPLVYAVMFSSLYSALMLILFALIIRGVSIEFRHQVEDMRWKRVWDICMCVGSALPAILFGVAFANIFQGIAFDKDGVYQGTLFTLLNPYGLLGGILFALFFIIHGGLWLAIKTEGDLQARAISITKVLWNVLVLAAVVFLAASAMTTNLYANYMKCPSLGLVIVLAVAGILGIRFFIEKSAYWKAWFSSALAIMSCVFFGIIGLYPNLFPSSIDAAYNLTAFNAASSPLTLTIMLIVVIIFVPIVIGYQVWVYNMFKGKVSESEAIY